MNKHLSRCPFGTSLLLAACGGMDSQSEAAAENNDASLNEDVSEPPAFEPSSRPQVLSYSGSSNTATLNQDNMTEVANAALKALSQPRAKWLWQHPARSQNGLVTILWHFQRRHSGHLESHHQERHQPALG